MCGLFFTLALFEIMDVFEKKVSSFNTSIYTRIFGDCKNASLCFAYITLRMHLPNTMTCNNKTL